MLLPRILPMQRPGWSSISVEEMLVKSSGREVTAERRIPPRNAPEREVVLSSISTYSDALIDMKVTKAATTR
jgi:hypothetical protein